MQFDKLSEQDFLSRYWQRQWLFCPQAVPGYESPISADELAGLALEDEVESRIVITSENRYTLHHGPFDESYFATEQTDPWTLLVQAVDLWIPQLSRLFEQFNFLPRWRMDDIMVSYATPGGGVGPHFDHYDVFLVQVQGSRTWRLGQQCDAHTPVQADSDLQLLAEFNAEAEVTAQPGDVLYVPPGIAHWGVSETDSLTYSVGFRAPTLAELLDDLAIHALEHNAYYRDPPLSATMAQKTIDPACVEQAKTLLSSVLEDEAFLADWFARFVTMPKYPDLLEQTNEARRARVDGRTYLNGEVNDEVISSPDSES